MILSFVGVYSIRNSFADCIFAVIFWLYWVYSAAPGLAACAYCLGIGLRLYYIGAPHGRSWTNKNGVRLNQSPSLRNVIRGDPNGHGVHHLDVD